MRVFLLPSLILSLQLSLFLSLYAPQSSISIFLCFSFYLSFYIPFSSPHVRYSVWFLLCPPPLLTFIIYHSSPSPLFLCLSLPFFFLCFFLLSFIHFNFKVKNILKFFSQYTSSPTPCLFAVFPFMFFSFTLPIFPALLFILLF